MRTPGFSGADLANLLNEAAILAGAFCPPRPPACGGGCPGAWRGRAGEALRAAQRAAASRPPSRSLALWRLRRPPHSHTATNALSLLPPSPPPQKPKNPKKTPSAGRRKLSAVTLKEVDDAVDRIVAGMEGRPLMDGKAKALVAYHEARCPRRVALLPRHLSPPFLGAGRGGEARALRGCPLLLSLSPPPLSLASSSRSLRGVAEPSSHPLSTPSPRKPTKTNRWATRSAAR